MKALIQIQNQGTDLVADSREVAQLFGIDHENLRESITNHQPQLEQLGVFRFQTGKPSPQGGRPEKYALLNFDQIAFLLTISRPSERTKDFRLRLIIAFREARARLRPVDTILLSIPDRWRKTFKDDFYIALLRLYGEQFDKAGDTPSWVGGWTNKFIYEPIYGGLSRELKAKRTAYCGSSGKDGDWIKLHQFLEEYAKEELRDHITTVTTLLRLAHTRQEFIESFASLFYGQKQLKFIEQLMQHGPN